MSGSFVEDTLAQASKAGGRAGIRVFEAILCCNHDRVVAFGRGRPFGIRFGQTIVADRWRGNS